MTEVRFPVITFALILGGFALFIPLHMLGIISLSLIIIGGIKYEVKGGIYTAIYTTCLILAHLYWQETKIVSVYNISVITAFFMVATGIGKTVERVNQQKHRLKAEIVEHRQTETELEYKTRLLDSLLENIPDSIYFKDRNHRFIEVSRAKSQHHNLDREDFIGKTDYDFYPETEADYMYEDDEYVLKTGKSIVNKEEKITRPDGSTRWVSVTKVPRYNEGGEIIGSLGISRDITEQKQIEQKLKEYATYDSLTGVYNRRVGLTILREKIKTARRQQQKLTICYIDIDNLKQVNDSYGHNSGDELIGNVARLIKQGIRENDSIARIGGDEFLIVFPDCSLENARQVVDRINSNLLNFNQEQQPQYSLSISWGLAEYNAGDEESVDQLISRADNRMYKNKQLQKNYSEG
ncbi:MAG: sensor domain-containing diguanylate cyclase [Bacillota bacterium]